MAIAEATIKNVRFPPELLPDTWTTTDIYERTLGMMLFQFVDDDLPDSPELWPLTDSVICFHYFVIINPFVRANLPGDSHTARGNNQQ